MNIPPTSGNHFFIKHKHRYEKISHEEILWLKAESSYVAIQTQSKSYLHTSDTLSSFLEKTPDVGMLRIHRSYAINTDMVEAIEGNCLIIQGNKLPIGKSYLTDVKKLFKII